MEIIYTLSLIGIGIGVLGIGLWIAIIIKAYRDSWK